MTFLQVGWVAGSAGRFRNDGAKPRFHWGSALLASIALAACSTAPATTGPAAPGVTKTAILVGGTAPLSGPHAADGTIARAADAYLQYVNAKGGVHGRKVEFIYLDDAGDPARTATLTRQLVEQDNVLLTVAGIGTAGQLAVHGYLESAKVPQVLVASGAAGLDGWEPAYRTEGAVFGAYAASKLHPARIGVILEDSPLGKESLAGLEAGLGPKASLIRNREFNNGDAPVAVAQVAKLKSAGTDTLFVFQSPRAAILTLVAASRIGWRPHIFLPWASQSPAFLQEVQRDTGNDRQAVNGVTSAAFLRNPDDPSMRLYRQVMASYYPAGNPADPRNVYGMGLAFTLVDALGRAGDNPTRQGVLAALKGLSESDNPCLLPGITWSGAVGPEQIVTYDATTGVYKATGGLIAPGG